MNHGPPTSPIHASPGGAIARVPPEWRGKPERRCPLIPAVHPATNTSRPCKWHPPRGPAPAPDPLALTSAVGGEGLPRGAMRIGIIGLPRSGKSTLFGLLTHAGGPGHETGIGAVKVPDARLDHLATLLHPKKVTPVTIEFVDFPPLAKGAGKGEGFAAQAFAQMRTVDALLEVVRAFADPAVPHPEGSVDPARDADLVEAELLLADLDVAEKRIARIDENLRRGRKGDDPRERPLLIRCHHALAAERALRALEFTPEEERLLRGFQFLTAKPLIVTANVGEQIPADIWRGLAPLMEAPASPGRLVLKVAAKAEAELAELPPEEAAAFR